MSPVRVNKALFHQNNLAASRVVQSAQRGWQPRKTALEQANLPQLTEQNAETFLAAAMALGGEFAVIGKEAINPTMALLLVLAMSQGCIDRAIGNEADAQVQKDAVADVQVQNDAYVKPCEPSDASSRLYVPSDYQTVAEALEHTGRGDVVEVEAGHESYEDGIVMGECTHLQGPHFAAFNRINKSTPDLELSLITMADGSSITYLDLKGYGNEKQGTLIEVNDASVIISSNMMEGAIGIHAAGNSDLLIRFNHLGRPSQGIILRDNSSADIIDNKIFTADSTDIVSAHATGVYLFDNAYAKFRWNKFGSMTAESVAIRLSGNLTTIPDIGLENDHGRNWFHTATFIYLEQGYDRDVNFRGNCFYESDFNEMTSFPNPYANEANIALILDRHDVGNPLIPVGLGTVDYRNIFLIVNSPATHCLTF